MKTLADLKRNAHKYQWQLIYNSWLNGELPEHLTDYREVAETTTKQLGFKTWKYTLDGKTKIPCSSWIDWPKASELTIIETVEGYGVHINRIIPIDKNMCRYEETVHTMIYKLKAA